jgi:hypothetical protein
MGAAECVQVCTRAVLETNGRQRKVEIKKPDQCINVAPASCNARRMRCAFATMTAARWKPTIRRTRLNLLGKCTVEVPN